MRISDWSSDVCSSDLFTHEHHREWTFTDFGGERPSDLFKRHVICCFIDDQFGVKNLEYMNVDMVAYECDYPHSDTVWPNVPEYLWASVNGLDKGTIDKITHLNEMREYSFDARSEAHTSELQSLMRLSYAVF